MKTITLELRPEDAEPILRDAAYNAARFGAHCDYVTRRTVRGFRSAHTFDEERAEWLAKFLKAKRIVEAFGVEHSPTSEQETLGVYIPDKVLKAHNVNIGGVTFRHVDKSVPDPKNSRPSYQGEIHSQACHAAAARVVKAWQATL